MGISTRGIVGFGGLAAVFAMAGCAGQVSQAAVPAPAGSVTQCPAVFEAGHGKPVASRTGPLVPEGPARAVLCRYPFADSTTRFPLGSAEPSTGDAAEIARWLNALRPQRVEAGVMAGCTAVGGTGYVVVLTYGAGSGVAVNIDVTCTSVESGGAVSELANLPALLAYWPPES